MTSKAAPDRARGGPWDAVVATVLTLLGLPALYAAWFRVKRPAAPPRDAGIEGAGPVPG